MKESGILERLDPGERRLQEALFEIVSSETSYLKSLNVLVFHFANSQQFSPGSTFSQARIGRSSSPMSFRWCKNHAYCILLFLQILKRSDEIRERRKLRSWSESCRELSAGFYFFVSFLLVFCVSFKTLLIVCRWRYHQAKQDLRWSNYFIRHKPVLSLVMVPSILTWAFEAGAKLRVAWEWFSTSLREREGG